MATRCACPPDRSMGYRCGEYVPGRGLTMSQHCGHALRDGVRHGPCPDGAYRNGSLYGSARRASAGRARRTGSCEHQIRYSHAQLAAHGTFRHRHRLAAVCDARRSPRIPSPSSTRVSVDLARSGSRRSSAEALPRAHVHVHAEQHLTALMFRAIAFVEAAAAAAPCHSSAVSSWSTSLCMRIPSRVPAPTSCPACNDRCAWPTGPACVPRRCADGPEARSYRRIRRSNRPFQARNSAWWPCASTAKSWVMNSMDAPGIVHQRRQQVHDLTLRDRIQCGGRFVGDDESRRGDRAPWRCRRAGCWPPDSSCGYFASTSSDRGRPCASTAVHAFRAVRPATDRSAGTAARPTCCATVITGFERGGRILEHHAHVPSAQVGDALRPTRRQSACHPISTLTRHLRGRRAADPIMARWRSSICRSRTQPTKPTRSPSAMSKSHIMRRSACRRWRCSARRMIGAHARLPQRGIG